jgi:acetolactate synthase-1/3 small subunit
MTDTPVSRHCFCVLVDNEPGVLARVVGLFSGRGYNIESLTVDEVDATAKLSRMTIVTLGTPTVIEQIQLQLGRLVPVREVINLTTSGKSVEGCMAFVKLIGDVGRQGEATLIARRFGARIADTHDNAIIFEVTTAREKTDQMVHELSAFGRVELVRTGIIAMSCGDKSLGAIDAVTQRRSA